MSSFLCGRFVLQVDVSCEAPAPPACWHLVGLAQQNELHLMLGCCVVQDLVLEAVGIPRGTWKDRELAFLLTGDPLKDTSEEILEPPVLVAQRRHDTNHLTRQLSRCGRFFASAMLEEGIGGCEVYVFDAGGIEPFEELVCSANEFEAKCLDRLMSDLDVVPSLKFDLRSA